MAEWAGKSARLTVVVTEDLLDRFVAVSGDSSPIHVSTAAAKARGFAGRVAHGLLLGSLVSSIIGTQLPGEDGVLQEIKLAFHNPCYVGDTVVIDVGVSDVHESVRALTCSVRVSNQAGLLLAKGHFRSGLVEVV
jgi:3-hydroxybutyryl-CoA dehydratase